MTQENGSSRQWLTEGVFLAALPFFGYLLGFVFEAGYGSHYEIPTRLIQVDFITVVIATGVAATYLYFIFIYVQWAVLLGQSKPVSWRAVGRIMYWALLPIIFLIISGSTRLAWAYLAAVVALGIVDYLIVPVFSRRNEVSYWVRVEERLNRQTSRTSSSTSSGAARIFDRIEAVVGAVVFALLVCFGIGRSYAESEYAYWILEEPADTILLRKYGDFVILKGYDANRKELKDGIQVKKMPETGAWVITKKTLGTLKKAGGS